MAPEIGTQYALTDIRITKTNFHPIHLACAWAVGGDEPWLVATNLAQPIRALKEYRRRFGCEELFSDLKKRGFNWEDSMIRATDRFSRLLLALALLTVFLLELGRYLRRKQYDLEIVSPSLESIPDRPPLASTTALTESPARLVASGSVSAICMKVSGSQSFPLYDIAL